jgi:hypothetical protein
MHIHTCYMIVNGLFQLAQISKRQFKWMYGHNVPQLARESELLLVKVSTCVYICICIHMCMCIDDCVAIAVSVCMSIDLRQRLTGAGVGEGVGACSMKGMIISRHIVSCVHWHQQNT